MPNNLFLSLLNSGLAASRPATPDVNVNQLYFATDTGAISLWVAAPTSLNPNAGAWQTFMPSSAAVTTPVTVANLPASPIRGQIAIVTDATTPTMGATVAGAGAVTVTVMYNGSAWKVIACDVS